MWAKLCVVFGPRQVASFSPMKLPVGLPILSDEPSLMRCLFASVCIGVSIAESNILRNCSFIKKMLWGTCDTFSCHPLPLYSYSIRDHLQNWSLVDSKNPMIKSIEIIFPPPVVMPTVSPLLILKLTPKINCLHRRNETRHLWILSLG